MTDNSMYRIRVNTDKLSECGEAINRLSDEIGAVASMLSALNTSEEWWEKVGGFSPLVLKDERSKTAMGTARDAVAVLSGALRRYDSRAEQLGKAVNAAAKLFETAEERVKARIDGQSAGEQRNVADAEAAEGITDSSAQQQDAQEPSKEEQIRELEDQMVSIIEAIIANDFVQSWYDKLNIQNIANAGLLYNLLQLKGEDLVLSQGISMLDGILDRYSKGWGALDTFKKTMGGIKDGIDTIDDSVESVELLAGLYTEADVGKAIDSLAKKYPGLAAAGSDGADILSGLKDAAKVAGNLKKIAEGLNRFVKLMNMPPATAASLANGLKASGDANASYAANVLGCVGNTAACLACCVATSGVDFGVSAAGKIAREAVSDAMMSSPAAPIAAAVKVTSFGTDTILNTSDTAKAAVYSEAVNNMRGSTRDALNKAIQEYHRNPNSANANKVADLYKTYNTQSAEQVKAVKKIGEASDDSLLGKIFGNETKHEAAYQQMEQLDKNIMSNNQVLDVYQQSIAELRG